MCNYIYVTPSQEPPEPMVLVSPHDLVQSPQVNALEALLEGSSNFHAMLDMPPDADDERMVELAIALSLQEQSGSHGAGLSLHGIMGGHQQVGGYFSLSWACLNILLRLCLSEKTLSSVGRFYLVFMSGEVWYAMQMVNVQPVVDSLHLEKHELWDKPLSH